MSIPSKQKLEELFNDEQVANNIHAAEATVSLPALRILRLLTDSDSVRTEEIAEELDLDVVETNEYLNILEEHTIITHTEQGWTLLTEKIQLTIDLSEQFSLTYALNETQKEVKDTDEPDPGQYQRWLSWGNF